MYDEGLTYSSINTARSALSTFVTLKDGSKVGTHPLVCRLLKGVYQQRTPLSKYNDIWDVDIVLCYLKKLSPVRSLNLKQLTLKLVMLLALVSGQRGQTIHVLNLNNMTQGKCSYTFTFERLKQSRPGVKLPCVKLKPFVPDKRLCVVTVLTEYLARTSSLRGQETQLLISYIKPYKKVSRDTISRWVRVVLVLSGIDTSVYKPHSTRVASASAAKRGNVPLSEILKTAGWSSSSMFAKYYDKPIIKQTVFADRVLSCKQ